LTNTGTLQATIGSLILSNGNYTNIGGRITAQQGGTVILNDGAIITGGLFASGTGGGQMQTNVVSSIQVNDATISNVGMTVVGTSSLTIGGAITNNGSLNVTAGAAAAKLFVGAASVGLIGTGTTTLSTTGAGTAIIDGSGGTLNIGSQQLVRGAGTLGNNAIALTNNGTIAAFGTGATLTVNPSGGNLVNNGTMTAGGGPGSTLAIVNPFSIGTFLNNGTILAMTSGTVSFGGPGPIDSPNGTIIVNSGATLLNTTILKVNTVQDDGQFTNLFRVTGPNIGDAIVMGSGSFTNGDATHTIAQLAASVLRVGTVTVNQGTVTIAANTGTLGTGSVSSLSIGAAGRLDLSNHDFIVNYSGNSPLTSIANWIATGFANQAWNGPGIDSFIAAALDANPGITHKVGLGYADASMIGSPATFGGQSIDSTASLIRYTYLGDANLDLRVNAIDFNILATNFGSGGGGGSNKRWFQGDFNYDGTINSADFNALAINFNLVSPSPLLGSLVPEPALPGLALLGWIGFRRRSHLVGARPRRKEPRFKSG
jgi:hypothetical protein